MVPRKLDYKKMLEDINDIVNGGDSGDWGFSVTDDMVDLQTGKLRQFSQKQAEEMSEALSSVYMIAHAVSCTACGTKYVLEQSHAS